MTNTYRTRNFCTESLFSLNFPELRREFCGEKRCIEMSLFTYGNSPEMRETEGKLCGKNSGMEMSLFLHENSGEMRETEGNYVNGNEMSLFLYGILRK